MAVILKKNLILQKLYKRHNCASELAILKRDIHKLWLNVLKTER